MLESDIIGTCLKKEGGLEGRDQAEDPFHDSRKKNTTQSSGNRQERTDVCGRVGTDSLGTGKWLLSGEWGEGEQR